MVDAAVSHLLDGSNSNLVLRIRGSSRDGQVLRLKSAKCTLGSDRRCTLRLATPGVQPVHCLIIRGPARTIVRRWGPDTRLNGSAFADAELAPGDRLGVGPLEFEVLDPGVRAELLSPPRGSSPGDLSPPQTTPLGGESAVTDKAKEIEAGLAGMEAERQASQKDCQRPETELQTQSETLQLERQRLEAERQEWEARIVARAEELENRRTELETLWQTSINDRQRWEAQRQAFQDDRQRWETNRREREAQLDAVAKGLEAGRAEIETQKQAWAKEHKRLEGRQEESVTSGEAAESPGLSSEDIFRRLGMIPPLSKEDREGIRDEPEGNATPVDRICQATERQAPQAERPAPSPSSHAGGDEESIDAYMARLLQRVRGMGGERPADVPGPQAASPPPPMRAAAVEESKPEPEAPRPTPPDLRRRQPVEMPPRAASGERNIDLSAMRELANLSAQTALDRHAQRRHWGTLASKLTVMLMGLVVGGVALSTWWSEACGEFALYAAMACFLIAALWGIQYVALSARQRAANRDAGPEDQSPRSRETGGNAGNPADPSS